MTNLFGELFRQHRVASGQSLRSFCLDNGFDPGNISKLERGRMAAPESDALVDRYADALGLFDDDVRQQFTDAAAAARGVLPKDLQEDEIIAKLPLLFRTIRSRQNTNDSAIDELIEKIRQS